MEIFLLCYTICWYCISILLRYVPFFQQFFSLTYKWRTGYGKTFGYALLLVIAFAILETIPTALSYYLTLDISKIKTVLVAILPFCFSVFSGKAAKKVQSWTGQIAIYLLGALGPFIIFILYATLCKNMLDFCPKYRSCLAIIIIVDFIVTRVFTDINTISFHNYYRDQLSKAFLFRLNSNNKVEHNDGQKLSSLNKDGSQAPYHLINVTLNLQGSKDKNLRDRHADCFILSKLFCGSTRTGFCKTKVLERYDPHLNLGTAMAISGAAASPNMGTATIKPLVFIMTTFKHTTWILVIEPIQIKRC